PTSSAASPGRSGGCPWSPAGSTPADTRGRTPSTGCPSACSPRSRTTAWACRRRRPGSSSGAPAWRRASSGSCRTGSTPPRSPARGTGGGAGARARWLGRPPGARAIGVLARLRPEKDHATFLRAARLVADRRPDARFLLVGDGPLRDELRALAEALGIGERVV